VTDETAAIEAQAPPAETGPAAGAAYRVLARKYRPTDFSQMVGQEALVRTLTNAIRTGRLAHAFMLTGVRGVGKTTTARIIARALNCIGPDGTGGPTVTPCGVCEHCRSIAADRHVDVMEMDAASRTGVNDIREIIDGVRYGPVSARYKIYIIDEVHMLSNSAFNALLKTLEEPPAHVKFVFATTEIRKVPVTVLSRCQRFDLRRVDAPTLVAHFTRVAGQEGIPVDQDAVAMIARAADGSVRDGMSLLDQAIALGGDRVTAVQVRDMLGLADRARVIDLFEAVMSGRPRDALDILADLHRVGADPVVVIQDLLDLTHFLTRFKVVPETAEDPATPEIERTRGAALAGSLAMPVLSRAWQILLKGLSEVQSAPVPADAAEMVIVRLAYSAELPTPGEIVRQIQGAMANGAGQAGAPPAPRPGPGSGPALSTARPPPTLQPSPPTAMATAAPQAASLGAAQAASQAVAHAEPVPDAAPEPAASAAPLPMPRDFRQVVALFDEMREIQLWTSLYNYVHPVRCEPGLLEFRPGREAAPNLAGRVSALLSEWTGRRWMVSLSSAPGEPPLASQDRNAKQARWEQAAAHPIVQAVMETFPGATIVDVRDHEAMEAAMQPALQPDADGDLVPDMPGADLIIDEAPSWLDEEGEF
jgi:DNA polymerase III subunit gamma/tau